MNKYAILCRCIDENNGVTQRTLSKELRVSLGSVNNLLNECVSHQYIKAARGSYQLTEEGGNFLKNFKVDNAVILAAGFGSRFVPLTYHTPKGLLEVFGERMIERQIRQLHEAGITDITIVVGYLKEKFEYLIDKYEIKLLYNPEYASKNSLSSLYLARHSLKNTYILASDNWLRENMYHQYEGGSWYSVAMMTGDTSEWCVVMDKKGRIKNMTIGGRDTPVIYGPAYFTAEFSQAYIPLLEKAYNSPGTENQYWEQILLDHIAELPIYGNMQPENQVYEFENLEELRLFDARYQVNSDNEAMKCIAKIFAVTEGEIYDIKCLKAGMTNKSFLFKINEEAYIFRIPGPGTDLLINRHQEKACFEAVAPFDITEDVIYFNGDNGYKISRYYEGSRNADSTDKEDMARCMKLLKQFHQTGVQVEHEFDIRERIGFYQELCQQNQCIYFEDYWQQRQKMDELMDYLDSLAIPKTLSHIDSVADNFIFLPDGRIRLIDWEYAGMCDPMIDIGMCAIYSFYNEEEADWLLDTYLEKAADTEERSRMYAYMALGGFLWALWGLYKASLGEEFGEYTLKTYRYSKKYYKKVMALINRNADTI